jgi:hypothetical protein
MVRVGGSDCSRRVYSTIVPRRRIAAEQIRWILSGWNRVSEIPDQEIDEHWIVLNAADLSLCGTMVAILSFGKFWFWRSGDLVASLQPETYLKYCSSQTQSILEPSFSFPPIVQAV